LGKLEDFFTPREGIYERLDDWFLAKGGMPGSAGTFRARMQRLDILSLGGVQKPDGTLTKFPRNVKRSLSGKANAA